jgi:hypothetical protein
MTFPELSRSEYEHIIDEWVFNEKARAIIKRRMLDGITYDKLSEEFDMSVRQIQNIVYKTEQIIIKHI